MQIQPTEQARFIAELQALDSAIVAAEKALHSLPQKQAILDVRHRRKELEAKTAKIAQALQARAQEEQRLQTQIEQLDAKISSEEAKIAGTAAYKEVEQLTKDMQSLNKRRSELEDKELKLMDDDDRLNAAAAQAAQLIVDADKKEAELIADYRAQGGQLQIDIVEMEHQRDSYRDSVEPALLARYDKLRAGHNGIGVATIDKGYCNACGMEVNDSQINNLMHQEDVGLCPHCHRLLVVGL
jgi:predicted  nucleic acid-binding Zn-ribbon protein